MFGKDLSSIISYIANICCYICEMKIRKAVNIEGSEDALFIASIADALSHPVRVALIHYVGSKNRVRNDVCNKDLVAHFPYSQSSLSQHVKKLIMSDLFTVEYSEKFSFYSVNKKTLRAFNSAIAKLK